MAYVLYTKFLRTLSEDANQTSKLKDKTQTDIDNSTHDFAEIGNVTVAAAEGGNPGSVTLEFAELRVVKYIDIETDAEITVTLGGQSYVVTPVAASVDGTQLAIKGKLILMTNEDVSDTPEMVIENNGDVAAAVAYTILGTEAEL